MKGYSDQHNMTDDEKEEYSKRKRAEIEERRGKSLKVSNMQFPGDRVKAARNIRG